MKIKLVLCLGMLLFLTACAQDMKPTETISAAPEGAAKMSTSATESHSQVTSETASTKESTEATTESNSETESSPMVSGERKEVLIDLALQETLSPPPEVKEVFRTKNETLFTPAVPPGDTLHLVDLEAENEISEPGCFAALSENEFIIADTVARYFKLFRDGKCVENYFMPSDVRSHEIEIDNSSFYYSGVRWDEHGEPIRKIVRVDLQTGNEVEIPLANPQEDMCTELLWMDGQLIFINGYIHTGETNYYLDMEQGIFVPTSKGYHRR